MLAGIAGAALMAKFLVNFLYGNQAGPIRPTFLGSLVVLSAVALAACSIPAIRAARVDPAVAAAVE